MGRVLTALAVMAVVFVLAASSAMAEGDKNQINHRYSFSNAYAHFNQWFRDDDGDGLLNCLDADYARMSLVESPGDGNVDTQDKNRIRTRVMKRDGTLAGSAYIYRHRNLRSEE